MLESNQFYDQSPRMLRFFLWDAGPDLAQATWEWPPRYRMHRVETTPEGVLWELR